MYTKAYFENIREAINKELKNSKTSVQIAVAWFTDTLLFNTLIEQGKQGVIVKIIVNDDNINSSINFNKILDYGGYVKRIDPINDGLMHNKFCIIDSNTVISGSYNWTNKAKYNNESITVIRDNQQLTSDFLLEFNNLLGNHFSEKLNQSSIDWNKIIYRINAIKSLLLINEYKIAFEQLIKLKKEEIAHSDISEFIYKLTNLINKKEAYKSIIIIDKFISEKSSIKVFNDPELYTLKNEISYLKSYIHILTNKKSELLKTIQLFQLKHNEMLGPITKKILEARIELSIDNPRAKEKAKKEYERYNKNYQQIIKNSPESISVEKRLEIKMNYREASKLCHPDLVEEKLRKNANQIFIRLNSAYQNNDLLKVNQILKELKTGIFKEQQSPNKKKELISMIEQLRSNIDLIEMEIDTLIESDTFLVINNLGDWDKYFDDEKRKAEEYLKSLTKY